MAELIKTEKLSKTYKSGKDGVKALRNCNIMINENETVAIVGPSGSGKSTLLHVLGGLLKPTEGSVLFGGEDIYNLSDAKLSVFRRRSVGFVFQAYNLVPELTAYENILLPLMLDGKKADKKYIEDMAESLGIGGRLRHFPSQLSGGEQQRVALARALSNRPRVLLCDEPTGNLDTRSGNQVLELLLGSVEGFGVTLVVVTHDMSIAAKMERKITIVDGEVSEEGVI